MMPILQASGVMTPGQFGPIRSDLRALERALDLHHVEDRDALGDGDDELEPASIASRMASAAKGGGTKIMVAVAPVFSTRLGDGVEDGQADVGRAALAGGDAADDLGAVGDGLLGVEGALRAGEALADDAWCSCRRGWTSVHFPMGREEARSRAARRTAAPVQSAIASTRTGQSALMTAAASTRWRWSTIRLL